MIADKLQPKRDLLREEFVLVQAWKKASAYIRYHNWFSDTLELDRVAVNLPSFLAGIRRRLDASKNWKSGPLRIVPAPKSQKWQVQSNSWTPVKEEGAPAAQCPCRPLAHVSLADQVVATAVMLCLADRVETLQGHPSRSTGWDEESRRQVISYGNRLFCDSEKGELRHRWGSSKLYRAYYHDYRTFIARPENVGRAIAVNSTQVFVVHADLRQFYDRVRPDLLARALDDLRKEKEERDFFDFARSLLNWRWDPRDEREVKTYAQKAKIDDFTRVVLPQGLVASGFFANVVLLRFDHALRRAIGTEIRKGILLADACRYVDDLRITVSVELQSAISGEDVKDAVYTRLRALLASEAAGLELSAEKTKVVAIVGDKQPLVLQSARMGRIQTAVSGGFDAIAGEEILDSIQGLMRAQDALSVADESGWRLSPVPDVGNETVARFGAARFRSTFRSIRPLLEDKASIDSGGGQSSPSYGPRVARTRGELDEDARAFALGLIQRWVLDPSNVRLLRIGLDLWPDASVLEEVLKLLRPFTGPGRQESTGPVSADASVGAPRRVAWYCLAEILKAGATETGLVPERESLPSKVDLQAYREALRKEAGRLLALPASRIPWYLRQQALLFLAAFDPASAAVGHAGEEGGETSAYQKLILYLRGEGNELSDTDFATFAVLARRAFAGHQKAMALARQALNSARLRHIAERDPSFALELLDGNESLALGLPARVRDDLCIRSGGTRSDVEPLASMVRREHPTGPLRNEIGLLRFAKAFLEKWQKQEDPPGVITPNHVELAVTGDQKVAEIGRLRLRGGRVNPPRSLYSVPTWCEPSQRWRFQLGFLLRFILSGQPDFTRPVRSPSWKESELAYRAAESHRYQRLYGMFSGQPSYGDDWLPITDWVERFLLALLRWPGCRAPNDFGWVEGSVVEAAGKIGERIRDLESRRGRATGTLVMPLVAKRRSATNSPMTLRACVVQTAVPTTDDFQPADLPLDDPEIRRRHRNHLSAALAAVERMLALRETHKGQDGRLDWLILPELAVHPRDVRAHLIPFARAHRSMILTGLTYERILPGNSLVNSALWIVPEWSEAHGLQIRTFRQGKANLAQNELNFNSGTALLRGFRPCQWLVGYPWGEEDGRPLWLTASVCYDATDLALAADLKGVSDVLAIPALNVDVKSFDQMALALHYHMFQLVIVANCGQYGGSNAYWPKQKDYVRQVFHTHGQPQASIMFFEIDDIEAYTRRHEDGRAGHNQWKYPPAGGDNAWAE